MKRWEWRSGEARGGHVLLNDVPVRGVTAFNVAEGWVEFFCVDLTHSRVSPHHDPNDESRACTVRREGAVTYLPIH